MVEALRYNSESRGLVPIEVREFFSICLILPGRTLAFCFAQLWQERVQDDLPGGTARQAHKADNQTALCDPIV
jgi:hypothetical protein